MRLINRACLLRVGIESDAVEIPCTTSKGLRLTFVVDKQLLGFPNTAIIKAYNLSEDLRARLREPGLRVELLASYDPEYWGSEAAERLFLGDLVNVNDVRENPDTVTTIWARDAFNAYTKAITSISMKEGTSFKTAVQRAYRDMKEQSSDLIFGRDQTEDSKTTSSMSFAGKTSDLLDKLSEQYGFNWSVQDGALVTIPKDQYNTAIEIEDIAKDTGMIGSPTITEIGADVKTLLNPRLIPNGGIRIQSSFTQVSLGNLLYRPINKTLGEGFQRINRVVHRGDTRGNEWSSSIIGRVL